MVKKFDIFFIAVLLAAALIAGLCLSPASGDTVTIYKNGELLGSYPLSRDNTVIIDTHNTVLIKGGRVSMLSADCPDGFCKNQGGIDRGSIVCLPNRVVVTVGSTRVGQPDAVTGFAGLPGRAVLYG